MPLYEFVLRFGDREEVRLGDRNGYRIGDEILIGGRRFVVTGEEIPTDPTAEERLILEPAS